MKDHRRFEFNQNKRAGQRTKYTAGNYAKLTFVEKEPVQKKRRLSPWILGVFVLISLTFLVLLQSSNLWKNLTVENASDTLLLYALSSLNFIALLIFGFIFLRSITKLARERRTFQLGAKIKTRLLLYFAAVSLLPIIAMAVFSYLFWNRAIDRWFTQIPENVIREARDVQTEGSAYQTERLNETTKMLATQLSKGDITDDDLRAISAAGNLTHIEVLSRENKTLNTVEKPLKPDLKAELDRTMDLVRSGKLEEPIFTDGQGFDVAFADLPGGRKLVIVPDLLADRTFGQLVESSLVEFDALKGKQVTIRRVGLLTLGVLTFLLIFASSWTAFYIARGLTVPIKALAEGADEIARGNLKHRVEVLAEDELALLVSAFNEMSSKLEENSAELGERRKYIETVLQSLSTGVISFDAQNRVSTINKAAVNILKLENADFSGLELDKVVSEDNRVGLERLIGRAKRIGHATEQADLQREPPDGSGESAFDVPVSLTATALPDGNGVVLVIEDLSELISAQRASAWQEVARRMAHEIKNPLTPIQLSAERILKRYFAEAGNNGDTKNTAENGQMGRVIDESTATILREVNSLKSMVDEFSRFARLPDAQLKTGNPNDIVRQAVRLYEDRVQDVIIELNLEEALPNAMVDTEQLKRVFVNLIENAVEAFDKQQAEKRILIYTRHDKARDLIVAEVSDNGNGIPPSDFQKLFQPYFSTKGRGTGLGLAIVRRIVTEHHGKINVVSNTPKGAKFILELPVL
jgi:nitrogen fixation/metabolism regulation signal transduction histidine kinase